jgi:hypothetical protein
MQTTLTKDLLKSNYIYATEGVKSTKEEYENLKYHVVRQLQVLGGRQGVVLGRDSNEELITLVDVKSAKDLKSALFFVSDYIANADTKTLKLKGRKRDLTYEALDYLQELLPRFSELFVFRGACKKYLKSIKVFQQEQSKVNSSVIDVLKQFSPDIVAKISAIEKDNTEGVLRSAVRNFYKTRLRNLKDEEYEILLEMQEVINYVCERGFSEELNDWERDINDYISSLYRFASQQGMDGRVGKGLKARVDLLHDLNERKYAKREEIQLCEQDLRAYDDALRAAGYRVKDTF